MFFGWKRSRRPANQATLAAAELGRDAGKRRAGPRADRGDCRQANHDDQRQHHGVFNGGGTIFGHEETAHIQSKHLHRILPTGLLVAALQSPRTKQPTHPIIRLELRWLPSPQATSACPISGGSSRQPANVASFLSNCLCGDFETANEFATRITPFRQHGYPANECRRALWLCVPALRPVCPFRGCEATRYPSSRDARTATTSASRHAETCLQRPGELVP